jgi:hypothetical protein
MAHAIKALLTHYDAAFRKRFNEKYPVTAKDAALAKRLLGIYELEQLTEWVDKFFELDDAWIKQTGYSFGVFSACLPKVIARSVPKEPKAPWTEEQIDHACAIQTQRQLNFEADKQARADEYYRTHPWAKREPREP